MNYSVEEFDNAKTKVMNYILYKKRTEQEVKNKFCKTLEENLLHDIIEYVKEAGYLSDKNYIERAMNEFENLNHLSRKEIRYKLLSKGIENHLIEDYFAEHREELEEYEKQSAKHIISKKISTMEFEDIKNHLRKKGYTEDSIKGIDKEG